MNGILGQHNLQLQSPLYIYIEVNEDPKQCSTWKCDLQVTSWEPIQHTQGATCYKKESHSFRVFALNCELFHPFSFSTSHVSQKIKKTPNVLIDYPKSPISLYHIMIFIYFMGVPYFVGCITIHHWFRIEKACVRLLFALSKNCASAWSKCGGGKISQQTLT